MSDIRDVKLILGERNVETILYNAKSGHISDQMVADMAQKLGDVSSKDDQPNFIIGNHKRRMERDRNRGIEPEVREVFFD